MNNEKEDEFRPKRVDEPIKIKKNMQIFMSNNFPRDCRWNLKMNYTGKLICAFLGFIDYEKDEDFVIRTVNARELAEYIGIRRADWRTVLANVADEARKGSILLKKSDGGWRSTGWVFYCDYNAKTDVVEFCLDGKLKPFFLKVLEAVKEMTGKTEEKKIGYYHLDLKSLYSESGYNLIFTIIAERYAPHGGKEYTVEDFCKEYSLPKSYKIFGSLKQRILLPSIAAVNKISDRYTMELVTDKPGYKKGRKIVKFFIKISEKEREKKPTHIPESASAAEKEIRELLADKGVVDNNVVCDMIKTINEDVEYVKVKIKDCENHFEAMEKSRKPIAANKKGGYIIKAIQNDYPAWAAEAEKRKADAEKKAEKEAAILELKNARKEGLVVMDEFGNERIMTDGEKQAKQQEKAKFDAMIKNRVDLMTDEQKARAIELLKEKNPTVYSRVKDKSFDDVFSSQQYRGVLSEIINDRFMEQTSLLDDSIELVNI